ncbi:MAG: carbohydrate ABC transporter permease [Clostridiales bacterium]|nr:carbohydrate ABC transporter permease [Clostridiales bacterium]
MIKATKGEKTFDIFNIMLMIILMIITLYPMYYVVIASLSDNSLLIAEPGIITKPLGFTTGAYKLAFRHPLLMNGYKNILFILAVGLPINIVMTVFCGYFMASKDAMLKKILIPFFMFTMFFSGGMIPGFLNIQDLGLYDSIWSLILPGSVSVYNAIITKTAIEAIPESLVESAYIDGAQDLTILFKIIIPLIKSTIAVLLLYYGVGHWNSWFTATIYIKDQTKLPLQPILRSLLIADSDILNSTAVSGDDVNSYAETIKYAAIVISTVPILMVYPFLQKYFMKGVMIGAVKG